jgi:multiple sugar transport system permease protein
MLGLPAVLYILMVAIWPILQGIWFSFLDYNLLHPARRSFVGVGNYLSLARDPSAVRALLNTFLFTVTAVGIELVLGLLLALALWRDSLFNRVALVLMLIPVTITPLAVGLVFKALLSAEFGYVGYFARALGIVGERGFFGYPATAMAAIIVIDVWQWTPFVVLVLLAGLKALPLDTIEAAAVDGATGLQRLWRIVLPMMLPAILLALVLRSMDAFRVFDSVFVTTKGGPSDATNVLMFYAVKQGLEFFNIGMGAAIANVMLVAVALMAVLFVLVIRRADRRMAGA